MRQGRCPSGTFRARETLPPVPLSSTPGLPVTYAALWLPSNRFRLLATGILTARITQHGATRDTNSLAHHRPEDERMMETHRSGSFLAFVALPATITTELSATQNL